jgi:2-methylcitrate dehydratase PrpD
MPSISDDLSPAMLAHPSCVIVPALLSCASVKPLSGRQWLCAYACGFEVGGKLSRAINPALYEMGFHATSVLGVVMAAAVAAYLLALDAETTLSALGTAASLASGLRANFGSMTMALHVGHAVSQGYLAVNLAARGFSSDPEALSGQYGFLDCFSSGKYDYEPFIHLGRPFELSHSGINFKFYPCGHPAVCAIEAALFLRQAHGILPETIDAITCFAPPWIEKTLNKNREVLTGKEGKVNLVYCIAVALCHGSVTEDDFKDTVLHDPMISDMRRRCSVVIDRTLPDTKEIAARVEIKLKNGRVVQHQCDRPSGSAESPPPWDRLIQKFRQQSRPVCGDDGSDALIEFLLHLEDIDNVAPILELLTPAKKQTATANK